MLNNMCKYKNGQVLIQTHDFSPYMSNKQEKLDMEKHAVIKLPVIPEWIADLIESGKQTGSTLDATLNSIIKEDYNDLIGSARFNTWCEETFDFDEVTKRHEAGKQLVMQAISLDAYRVAPPERFRVRKSNAFMKQSREGLDTLFLSFKKDDPANYRFVGGNGAEDPDYVDVMTQAHAERWVKQLPLLDLEVVKVSETNIALRCI